jgi:hypothetical protein
VTLSHLKRLLVTVRYQRTTSGRDADVVQVMARPPYVVLGMKNRYAEVPRAVVLKV